MKKRGVRNYIKSFFGSHLDPDNSQSLIVTKTEIDEKVKKILGVLESGDIDQEDERVMVAELVKDFSREYESLYSQYDDLKEVIRKKAHGEGENDSSSSSSSDSDSDKKGKRNLLVKKQIEAANLEVADLKKELKESEEIRADTESILNQKLEDVKKERDGLEAELEKKSQEVSEYVIQITNLRDEMTDKAKDHSRLQAVKNETEAELEREKQEKPALLNQINDVQKALLDQEAAHNALSQEHKQINELFKEREATIKKLTSDYKQAREMLEEYMSKLEETERVVQETGKDATSKESKILDLEETMESLRNEVEMKEDEIASLLEKMHNIEVKLSLTNQKLRMTEQAVSEKEEALRRIEATHLEKQALLKKETAVTLETYRHMIKEIGEKVNSTILNPFETLTEKLEEKHGRYKDTVVEATEMISKARKCVREMKEEKEEMEKRFEGKVREEEELKETLLGVGEEKIEAIRQLCEWIDHYKYRSEYLEEVFSKMVAARGQRRS